MILELFDKSNRIWYTGHYIVTRYRGFDETEVSRMLSANVGNVRRAVAKHVGSRVQVRSNLGRHKYDVTEGVITQTYPCIFLVEVKNEEEDISQTYSYSYTDVITKDVQLRLC